MTAARRLLAALFVLLLVPAVSAASPVTKPSVLDRLPIVLLVDLSSGQVLLEKNADRRFVPASVTKAMTAFVAFEMIDQGELDLDQRFPFTRDAFEQWGGQGSTMFLNAGDDVAVSTLLVGITTISANDASVVLAQGAAGSEQEWLSRMNVAATRIGMSQSQFGTPNGWPDEGRTFTTARDLVILGEQLTRGHPDLYSRFFGIRRMTHRGITQPNHDPITGRVRGADGIKTGFTNEAGSNFLGSAEREQRRLVFVVAGAESGRDRDVAARELIEWGFSAFEPQWLFAANDIVDHARVQGGQSLTVPLTSPYPIAASVPTQGSAAVELKVIYDGPLRAPIAKGQRVAELSISVEGMPASRVPLYAAEAVEVAGPIARLVNGLMSWFV